MYHILLTILSNISLIGPVHFSLNNHSYFYSGNESEYQDSKVNWLDARNICREYCMDLVSIETPSEDKVISDYIKEGNYIILMFFYQLPICFPNDYKIIFFRGFTLHLDFWEIVQFQRL